MIKWLLYAAGGLGAVVVLASAAWLYVTMSVETPAYAVQDAEGRFELREYEALIVAEVGREGPREAAVRSGFRALAGYIFARERPGDSIAMTAPVLQTAPVLRTAPGAGALEEPWRVGFVMPARYTLEALPPPATDDVALRFVEPRLMAAVRFSGRWTDARFQAEAAALEAWMSARGLAPAGGPILAYYNDPLTPGFLRRNEVLIPVAAD